MIVQAYNNFDRLILLLSFSLWKKTVISTLIFIAEITSQLIPVALLNKLISYVSEKSTIVASLKEIEDHLLIVAIGLFINDSHDLIYNKHCISG